MSRIYMVTYDFKDPTTEHIVWLSEELTRFPKWWHFIDGTWLIKTDLSAGGVFARLEPLLSPDANLLILEVGEDSAGQLPKQAWEWIEQNQEKQLAAQNS